MYLVFLNPGYGVSSMGITIREKEVNMPSEYSQKLKDPRWQKKRLQILERDEWNCQICHDNESTLVVPFLSTPPLILYEKN